jgi:dTDP-4-amino-4,6-dideoxy-D-galactose acyltransferase
LCASNAPCQHLEWDSEFFGRRIAKASASRLSKEETSRILSWCRTNRIECLYFLADADDARTSRFAEENGFRLVDVRVTLTWQPDNRSLADTVAECYVRPAMADDLPVLRTIARASHRDSRFYFDPGFPQSRCDDLYETWIEKSCLGQAEAVLVAADGAQPVGYVTCHLTTPTEGYIGLMGVHVQARGVGVGQGLVMASLRWFAQRGASQVTVVTQGRNCRAQRLYQRCGFLTGSVQLWYHRWFVRDG